MQWVKSHLMIVIVGAISVLSLTGLVLGYVLSSVEEELETDSRAMVTLQSVKPVNEAVIEEARRRQQAQAKWLEEFLQQYKDAKQYEPIEPKVFTATDHMEKTEAAYRFQKACGEKLRELLTVQLKAKDMPTTAELDLHVRNALAEKEKKKKEIMAGLSNAPTGPVIEPAAPGPRQTGGGLGGFGGGVGYGGLSAADQETEKLRMGLARSRARSILCYADMVNLDDRSDSIREGLRSNKSLDELTEEIWYAQVALWIQQDVLGGIGRLNDTAAAGLPRPADRWVANMPFKRLVSFQMGNYVAAGEGSAVGGDMGMRGAAAGSGAGNLLTAGPTATFTNRGSTPAVDVVRFRMQMVVDARSLLRVLEAISKSGFYTVVNIDTAEVMLQPTDYYIYGTAPIVEVTAHYEGCFLRSSYEKWLPEAVKLLMSEGRAGGLGKGANVSTGVRDIGRGPNLPTPRQRGGRELGPDDESNLRRRRN